MTAGTGNGLGTAVELLGGIGDFGDQPELFADVDDGPSSLTPAKRPAHRPKGSRNRTTEQFRQFFLSRYENPVVGLGETYSRTAEDLARELFLTREVRALAPGQQSLAEVPIYDKDGELVGHRYLVWDLEKAFGMQQSARIGAAPYIAQKQPLAIDVPGDKRGLLVLGDLNVNVVSHAAGDGAPPFAPPEENQQVIDLEPAKSHDEQSHDERNPLEFRDE